MPPSELERTLHPAPALHSVHSHVPSAPHFPPATLTPRSLRQSVSDSHSCPTGNSLSAPHT
eukprot:2970082-Rhodomonas_salina.1